MKSKSKYIIVRLGCIAPIVFTELLVHSDVADGIGGQVISAGFCHIDLDGRYVCYGESVSLGKKSRGEEDSKILNEMLGVY